MRNGFSWIFRWLATFALWSLVAGAHAATWSISLGDLTLGGTNKSYDLDVGSYLLKGAGKQYYELNAGAQDLNVSFALLNTAPDAQKVRYALYDDALDAWKYVFLFDSSDRLAKTEGWVTDAAGNAVTPLSSMTALLTAGHSYILAVIPKVDATKVWTSLEVSAANVSAVPLPGAVWLFGSALIGFMALSNRRKV